MRVLFVTRKFPPSVGGLETAAHGLFVALSKQQTVKLLKWGGSNKALPIVYPYLAVATLWHALFFKPDVIYLQDGMLAPIGAFVKLITKRPVCVSVHGLDITYRRVLYQKVIRRTMRSLDQLVAGSRWCQQEAEQRFPDQSIPIVTYGLDDVFYIDTPQNKLRVAIAKALHVSPKILQSKHLLLTTGRLVERKGVAWFVGQVMPELVQKNPDVLYVVCGDGPMRSTITDLINKHQLSEHVYLLGRVSTRLRNQLYNYAELFVMPNIPSPGDGEGFGLVAVEVSSCGTPVVGAKLEGVQDAVTTAKNGLLVPSGDPAAFARIVQKELVKSSFQRAKVRAFVTKNYSWDKVAKQYVDIFKTLF